MAKVEERRVDPAVVSWVVSGGVAMASGLEELPAVDVIARAPMHLMHDLSVEDVTSAFKSFNEWATEKTKELKAIMAKEGDPVKAKIIEVYNAGAYIRWVLNFELDAHTEAFEELVSEVRKTHHSLREACVID